VFAHVGRDDLNRGFENDLKLFILEMVEFKVQEEEKEKQWWPLRGVFM
jgi:hypothetical protein